MIVWINIMHFKSELFPFCFDGFWFLIFSEIVFNFYSVVRNISSIWYSTFNRYEVDLAADLNKEYQ